MVSVEEYESMNGQIGKDGKNTRRAAKKSEAAREKRFVDRLQHRRERHGGGILSRSDVALHNRPNDMYVIFDGAVFDATKFLSDHPGGKDILLNYAGKDITTAFLDMGHSQLAKFQLADLYVGDLPMIERVHLDDSTDEEEDEAESSGAESEYDEDGVKILKPNKKPGEVESAQGKKRGEVEGAKKEDEDRPAPQVDRVVANRYRRKGQGPETASTEPIVKKEDADENKYGRKPPRFATPGIRSHWRMLLNWEVVKVLLNRTLVLLWTLRRHLLLAFSFLLFLFLLSHIRIPWWLLGHDPSGSTGQAGLAGQRMPLEGDIYANDPLPVHDPSLLHANGHDSSHDASLGSSPLEEPRQDSDAAWVQPPREHDPKAVLYF